jgi:hypothetical protein
LDGAGDLDHDGVSNRDEYLANSRADRADSYPHIEHIVIEPTGILVRTFTTPERRFQVFFCDDLLGGQWQPFLNTNNLIGSWRETNSSESVFTFVDDFSGQTSGSQPGNAPRYYRIEIQPVE